MSALRKRKSNPGVPIDNTDYARIVDYSDRKDLPAAWFESYAKAKGERDKKIRTGGDFAIVEKGMGDGRLTWGVVPWEALMVVSGVRNPSMSAAQQARLNKMLDKRIQDRSGNVSTYRELIAKRKMEGWTPQIESFVDNAATNKLRREWSTLRADMLRKQGRGDITKDAYMQWAEAMQKDIDYGVKVPSYYLVSPDGQMWDIGKMLYEYATGTQQNPVYPTSPKDALAWEVLRRKGQNVGMSKNPVYDFAFVEVWEVYPVGKKWESREVFKGTKTVEAAEESATYEAKRTGYAYAIIGYTRGNASSLQDHTVKIVGFNKSAIKGAEGIYGKPEKGGKRNPEVSLDREGNGTYNGVAFRVWPSYERQAKRGAGTQRKVSDWNFKVRGRVVNGLSTRDSAITAAVQAIGATKRNPEDSAAEVYEMFHGTPSEEIVEYRVMEHEHTNFAGLGQLVNLRFITPFGKEVIMNAPDPDSAKPTEIVQLCCSEDRTQLYFVGGDQAISEEGLKKMGFTDENDFKDLMLLGVLCEVTYRTEKGFDKFKLTDYYHELGEESGVEPVLLYDFRSGLMRVAGGQYRIEDVGICN